jgi:hypothetical protein
MNIQFNDDELDYLRDVFNQLNPEEVIFMNHYKLAESTGINADRWKVFLLHPQVSTFLTQELQLFTEFQMKLMIRDATDDKRSVGAAQMMNALSKAMQDNHPKEGPIIVYTHVPLTEDQRLGSPVETVSLTENILAGIPDNWED